MLPALLSLLLLGQTFMTPRSETSSSPAKPYPSINFGRGGVLDIRGYGMLKAYTFPQTDSDSGQVSQNSTFDFASAKLSFRYHLDGGFSARFDAELGKERLELQELWFQYKPLTWLAFRAGRIRTPFGLAQTEGFLSRRYAFTPLLAGNATDRNDIGAMFIVGTRWFTIYGGAVTGARDTTVETNEEPDVVGRILVTPFNGLDRDTLSGRLLRGLTLGASGSYGESPGHNAFRGKTQTGFTYSQPVLIGGPRTKLGVEMNWKTPWFYLRCEYQQDTMAREGLSATLTYEDYVVKGWYIEAGIPLFAKTPMAPVHGLELFGRYEWISHSDGEKSQVVEGETFDVAPYEELTVRALSLGVSWHTTENLTLSLFWQGLWFSDERSAPDYQAPDPIPTDVEPGQAGPVHHFFLWARFQI